MHTHTMKEEEDMGRVLLEDSKSGFKNDENTDMWDACFNKLILWHVRVKTNHLFLNHHII